DPIVVARRIKLTDIFARWRNALRLSGLIIWLSLGNHRPGGETEEDRIRNSMRRGQAVFKGVERGIGQFLRRTLLCGGLTRQFNFDFKLLQRFPVDGQVLGGSAAR